MIMASASSNGTIESERSYVAGYCLGYGSWRSLPTDDESDIGALKPALHLYGTLLLFHRKHSHSGNKGFSIRTYGDREQKGSSCPAGVYYGQAWFRFLLMSSL
jgi:hypothetical protein